MSEWISVDDDLPKKEGDYLVEYNKFKYGLSNKKECAVMSFLLMTEKTIGYPTYSCQGFKCDDGISVTHRMPLPEPPEV